ncbi:MAG: LysR family transcriptional regulator [Bacteroidales bacterium]|nr:LysR family transcriptional regulator [Bacteroidales bacterium]
MLEEDFRLRVFVTVAEFGGFSAAARELGVTQSAVSQQIAELERQAGVVLFDRSRNSLSITPEGESLKKYADEILHWYGAANDSLDPAKQAEEPLEVQLNGSKTVQIWSTGGDLHLKLKEY